MYVSGGKQFFSNARVALFQFISFVLESVVFSGERGVFVSEVLILFDETWVFEFGYAAVGG